jgi:hypothetical protein
MEANIKVKRSALLMRVNRALEQQGKGKVKVSRGAGETELGAFLLKTSDGKVKGFEDFEKFAHDLGVLQPSEYMVAG